MNNERLLDIQTKRSAQQRKGDTVQKNIETVVNDCRRYIQENVDLYKNKSGKEKTKAISNVIVKFIMETKPTVEGFVDESGKLDTTKLINRLVQDITDYGILSKAMTDEDIFEIRCNGRGIKVEIKGHVDDYRDDDGRIIAFESPQQQAIVMRKLLGDVRLTPKDAVVNARTIEGYRVAALHHSALSPDPVDPSNDEYAAFVLRKFKKKKMPLGNIVQFKTLSDNMARFLALSMAGGLTFFTVGPTSSGKTTSNQAILQAVPPTTRVVLLQNPSEIDLRFRDAQNWIYNDVLHLEAQEKEKPSATDPTMENLMNHILRLSPTFVCFGELRSNKEFERGLGIGLAGHPFNCTFHAEDSEGAIMRFLTAYMAASGEGIETALNTLTRLTNIIIVQKILRDGSRKILQITEVLGTKKDDPTKPELNDIYKFVITRDPEYDSAGNVTKIHGVHKRTGKLSQKTIDKLKMEGIATSRFDFLLKDVDPNEEETYIGDNESIERYGLDTVTASKDIDEDEEINF